MNNWSWNPEQLKAIQNGVYRRSFCMIGAAGTGKTTTLKGTVKAMLENHVVPMLKSSTNTLIAGTPGIAFLSYTRRAVRNIARQMSDEMKGHCLTVHKILEYAPEYYDDYNEEGEKEGHQNTIIEQALRSHGIFYTEAKDAITSKEFWENYFTKRPKKKPSKIVYYKGGDPTEALYRWREENGIINNVKDKDFFEAKKISEKSSKGTVGINRFRALAKKKNKKYYGRH